jgi:catechol 2,3-dioxygenase-like lactoylglutathione lyase family enzyme
MSNDRWPLLDFYEQVLGLKPTRDTFSDQANIDTLIGAPQGTYYHFSPIGQGNHMELWEYRQRRARDTTTWPTNLDRTGLAMTTFLVNDLEEVKTGAKANGAALLGEGALPVPGVETQNAVFLRGAVGELIEVIGR